MNTDIDRNGKADRKVDVDVQGGSSETLYGLGLIGAWVYYIGRASTFEERVKGFFKGLFWPAFLVYALFEFLERERTRN
jgi:hypothetical protein